MIVRNVNVVPMDEEIVLENRTVLIEAGLISAISSDGDIEAPATARVIDGSGKYVMPGLSEMHAHVPGGEADPQYHEDILFLYLANGVTLARGMLGHPVHLELRDRLARGEIDGPRLITSGPGLRGQNVSSPGEGVRIVREQAESGYDFLKIFGGFSTETFDALTRAAREVGIPFAGHVPGNVSLSRALEAGYATIDHFDSYMPALVDPEETEGIDGGFFGYRFAPFVKAERISEIAERTREAGTWVVPTETIVHSAVVVDIEEVLAEREEFRYVPGELVRGWANWVSTFRAGNDYDEEAAEAFIQARLDLIAAFHEAGAGLLLGSDAPQWFNVPGFSVHREMKIMADAGLSPYEVLRTGTVNPARFLAEENVFGRVAEGLRADLILVEGNPLEDLANAGRIAGVVRHGRWYSREEIDQRLAEIAARREE